MIIEWIIRLARGLITRTGIANLLVLILLLTIQISVAIAILSAAPVLKDYAVFLVPAFGLLMGWTLARRTRAVYTTIAVGVLLGIGVIFIHVSRVIQPMVQAFLLALQIVLQNLPRRADWSPITLSIQNIFAAAQAGIVHISLSIDSLLRRKPQFDPLSVAFFWSTLLYLCAFWSGWIIRRTHKVLLALLPGIALAAITLNFVSGHPYPLMIALMAAFFLLILVDHSQRESGWNARGIDFSEELRIDLVFTGTFLSLGLVALAIIVPSVDIRNRIEIINRFSREQFERLQPAARSLGLQPGIREGLGGSTNAAGGLPRSHLLGSGPELSEQPVMRITVSIDDPLVQDSISGYPVSYYWRSITYDQYTGSGWSTSETVVDSLQPGDALRSDLSAYDRIITQQVERLSARTNRLYFAGELLTVDRGFRVAHRATTEEALSWDFFAGSTTGQTYRVQSSFPIVDQALLEDSGTDYPQWIVERFTELPQNMPTRVLQLSEDITAGRTTPFQKALAIEAYLRRIPYSLDIPAPPADRDVVDYFLFTLQQGYCDYYASAMVVMARAVGLPARLVIGYASGTYDAQTNRYFVTEAEAHSWPEIYFPSIGWVEFEPTAALPEPLWPVSTNHLADAQESYSSPWQGSYTPMAWLFRWWWAVAAVLFLGFAAILLVAINMLDIWRLSHAASSSTAVELYKRLQRQAGKAGISTRSSQTPLELGVDIRDYLQQVGKGTRLDNTFSGRAPSVDGIIRLYEVTAYSPHPPGQGAQRQAISGWVSLRYRLWIARLVANLRVAVTTLERLYRRR